MNKKTLLITLVASLFIIGLVALFITSNRNKPTQVYTGGSGKLTQGYLVLRGYDTPTNSKLNLPVSSYIGSDQQSNIRRYIEAILFKQKPLKEYIGSIVAGSAQVDYQTNTVTFDIKIQDPDVSYKVSFNTISEEIQVFGSDNEIMTPPQE